MSQRLLALLAIAAVGSGLLSAPALFAERARGLQEGPYTLRASDAAPPEDLREVIAAHVDGPAVTVIGPDGEALMDLWFAGEIPAPTAPASHPAVMYRNLPEGVVLAVMQLHKEHRDFRDQAVPASTYVVRYLRQPDDGDHLGETTFRDFGVLTSVAGARSAGPQRFDVTLGQALQLNTHPLVWGLWPGDWVATSEIPGIASHEAGKWAVKLSLPRPEGDPLMLALVVVGNERVYDRP